MPILLVDQVVSGSSLGLASGFDDLLSLEIGGRRVLYALNRAENQLVELEANTSGTLTVASTLSVSGGVAAGLEPNLAFVQNASGDPLLMMSGFAEIDGQAVTLASDGALGSQLSLASIGVLSSPHGLGDATLPLFIDAATGGGIALYSDTGSGFAVSGSLVTTADRYLADIAASTSFEEEGLTYIVTVSSIDNGLNIATATSLGLSQAGALGVSEGLPIGSPTDVAAVTRLDETLLVLTASSTSSVSVVRVTDGVPSLTDHVFDNDQTIFQGATQVAAITYGDFAFAAAGGAEGGVSLMTILPGGRLVHIGSVAEDETAPLDQITALDAYVTSNALHIVAGSANEAGLARLQYDLSGLGVVTQADIDGSGATGTFADDQVIGSVVGETLRGLEGDDILLDGIGNDVLVGGAGADLFVLVADGQWDQISDFEPGIDRLDLSAFDFLYDLSQMTITPTATGATLEFGDETVFVTTADASPLNIAELTNESILNVDRPPFLLIGREIVGTSSGEVLNGGPGNDTIAAAAGADSVTGGYGLDVLLGGNEDDTLSGGVDEDTLVGGSGNDWIDGDDGHDVIYGDDWG